jgi:hypothetical protein
VKYSEINKRAAGPDPSGLFVQTPEWGRVVDGRPLAQVTGPTLADSAQHVVQMQDIAEMVLLDRLMSQQDRFGNIHAIEYFYFPEEGGGVGRIKRSKVDDGEAPMPAGATLVKKMIMKDNDCGGPNKVNVSKNAGLVEKVRHMSPKLYANVRWLAANFAVGGEVPRFFVEEALFGQRDVDMLRANLAEVAPALEAACKSGALLLDLDLEAHLAGRGHDPAACDVLEPPGAAR